MKKTGLISILLALTLLCSCAKTQPEQTPAPTPTPDTTPEQSAPTPEPEKTGFKNNLTGEYELASESEQSMRPVAVSINNTLGGAQRTQTGLENADVMYETYVEGGLTRILAIYKDISKAGEIGSIRSARYDFVDICEGHDATFVHAGIDSTYAQPYMDRLGIDHANLLYGSLYGYVYRLDNGLALEHTLYGKGENIAKMLKDKNWRTTVKDAHKGDWQNFSESAVTPSGGKASTVNVAFSGDYKSKFAYDSASGMYEKLERPDWRSGKNLKVKNLVVLFTTLGQFEDGYRMKIGMNGGEGYYFTNGAYQKIKWTKGEYNASYKFTDEAGNPLPYNVGNSYVCIVSQGMQYKFEIGE